jgi:Saxitoxin biosynthesis operon protein SxtJ
MEGDDRLAHSVPARLSPGSYTATAGRKFGLTVGGAFTLLALIGRWRGHPTTFAVLGVLGILLVAAGLAIPTMLGPVERGWMKLAGAISKVTTPIFMGIVYFVILTPIGLLRRAFGGNALVHRSGPHGFWVDRNQTPRSSLDRQF